MRVSTVSLDAAENVLKDECPGAESRAISQLTEAFLDRKTDSVMYPEMLSFLSCCSLWNVMHRVHTMGEARQKQGHSLQVRLSRPLSRPLSSPCLKLACLPTGQ